MADIVTLKNVAVSYGENNLYGGVTFSVKQGEVFAIAGNSGSGKSTLLKNIVGLSFPTTGEIHLMDHDLSKLNESNCEQLYQQIGFLFQEGALFGNLTVAENIMLPMYKLFMIPADISFDLALIKLKLVGLNESVAQLLPSELSGGMRKRMALARALALDPKILFLDEPTAGLDPESAAAFDQLVGDLKEALNITVVLVTHDLSTLQNIADRIAIVHDHSITCGTLQELRKSEIPGIRTYFHSVRANEIFHP